MKNFTEWLKGVLDSKDSPSFGRTGAAFVVYFLVVWGTYIVTKTATIPEVPMNWIIILGLLWGGSLTKETITKSKEIAAGVTATPQADTPDMGNIKQ